ncbi:zinc finger, CCHC-type containing protein [Tanacetum coccineum]
MPSSQPLVIEEVVVQQPKPKHRKSKKNRAPKNFRPEFQLYLIEGTRDGVSDQHSYCFNVEDDPKTFDKAMKSQDVAFRKKETNDEMDSILGNNTLGVGRSTSRLQTFWLQMDLQKKLNVDGTIEKFKARLQAPKQWHKKFDEVVLSNGYLLNQADKCVYSKFDESDKGVINFLYVDDMLIFGTDKVQVDMTKEFLSLRFYMKDMREADVILGIRIKHKSNGITISQSHYIEKAVSQLEYSRVIGFLMYVMICTRLDIAFVVGKLILEGYTDASWINNTEDNSSTNGWVFFNENRFSSVPRLSIKIPNGTEDIGGSVVPEEDDPKTFDEAMKSQDVAFWKEAINDEMDSIMGNNT